MASQYISTKALGIENAREFIDRFINADSNTYYYLTISRTQPWSNDASPDVPKDNIENYNDIWKFMIGGKKIIGSDVSLVIPRVDWTANTVYANYSHTGNTIFGTNFYVLTDEYNLYKCIDNANNSISTVKPIYNSFDTTNKETDGYVWKYMLTIPTRDKVRFLSTDWIPIQESVTEQGSGQSLVKDFAQDGAIEFIRITNHGQNYSNNSNITVSIVGNGTGTEAFANVNVSTSNVESITVTSPGTGYNYANVTISGGAGSNANATAIISPTGGHGYDAVSELGASTVMINLRLIGDEEEKLVIGNDFSQFSILKNPIKYGTTANLFSNTAFSQTLDVSVGFGSGDYIADEFVYQGTTLNTNTFIGRVVKWDSSNSILRLTETSGSLSSALIVGNDSAVTRFVIDSTNYELKPFKGDILYIQNVSAIIRDYDQIEDIKFLIAF